MGDDAAGKLDDKTFAFLDFLMHLRNGISIAGVRSIGGRDRDADDAAMRKLVALDYIVVPPEHERPIVTTEAGRLAWESQGRERRRSGPEQ